MTVQKRKFPIITGENAKAFLKNEKENEEKLNKKAEQIRKCIEIKKEK